MSDTPTARMRQKHARYGESEQVGSRFSAVSPCWADNGHYDIALLGSRPQECQGHHRYPVRPAICLGPRRQDNEVDHVLRKLLPNPEQVLHIGVVDGSRHLHFDPEDLAVGALEDEVHFMVTVT